MNDIQTKLITLTDTIIEKAIKNGTIKLDEAKTIASLVSTINVINKNENISIMQATRAIKELRGVENIG